MPYYTSLFWSDIMILTVVKASVISELLDNVLIFMMGYRSYV